VGVTRVENRAHHIAAQRFNESADILETAAQGQLGGLQFNGATAGRQHTARGDALRWAVNRLAAEIFQWSRSSAEIAAVLVSVASGYAAADERASAAFR
jgi:hypothetical protein